MPGRRPRRTRVFHLGEHRHVIEPMLAQMGLAAEIEMIRPGYPPAGQGIIRLAVPACERPLRPLVPRRGKTPARVWGISLASHLDDRHVAARMAASARTVLGTAGITTQIEERSDSTAAQAGAAFALFADFIGGTRLGADQAGRHTAQPNASAPAWHASCSRRWTAVPPSTGTPATRSSRSPPSPPGPAASRSPSSPSTPRRPGSWPRCSSALRSVPRVTRW